MSDPDRWRRAIQASQFILLPDQRQFQIMWRLYEEFGVRHPETGEQYAFTYEQAEQMMLTPLTLCPVDLNSV